MTDAEIIKGLECCVNNGDCRECALNPKKGNYGYCTGLAIKSALDLINRQKAEIKKNENIIRLADKTIETQKAEIEMLNKQLIFEINSAFDRGRIEAYKEFAERLTSRIVNTPFGVNCSGETDDYREGCLRGLVAKQNNVIDMINNLLKKLEEENE